MSDTPASPENYQALAEKVVSALDAGHHSAIRVLQLQQGKISSLRRFGLIGISPTFLDYGERAPGWERNAGADLMIMLNERNRPAAIATASNILRAIGADPEATGEPDIEDYVQKLGAFEKRLKAQDSSAIEDFGKINSIVSAVNGLSVLPLLSPGPSIDWSDAPPPKAKPTRAKNPSAKRPSR